MEPCWAGQEELLELSSDQRALVPLPAVPKRNLAPWAEGNISSKKGSEVSYQAGPEVELWLGRKKRACPTRMALEEARMDKHSTSLWNCGT